LRNLVLAQREQKAAAARGEAVAQRTDHTLALVAAEEGALTREKSASGSRITLEKQLYYAKWNLTPLQFRGLQAGCALICFIPSYLLATLFIQILGLVMGWLIPPLFLEKKLNQRFEAFDEDYPVMLLSYVSLLKTGMSPIPGLEAAAKGLDEDSVVRAEINLLIERLRLGLSEEQAISAFGEDVNHPELELFVQSLILSRRVGGTLSSTLERLAKQVRKRQEFRKKAVAAVGMERTSLKAIACIMGALMIYLAFTAPQLVLPALTHPLGSKVFQFGIMLIVFGFYWSRKVTNIKI
jgi:tight adherence protein B